MSFFLGIDASTTATKALMMVEDGEVIGVASTEYTYETPRPMWTEQNPDLWWQGTCRSIREVLSETGADPAAIRGVGLTGQMHGLVVLDGAGEVLRPAILWNDQRTAAECEEMRQRLGRRQLIQITGNDALTGFTAPKILWIKNNEPQIYRQIKHILLPKDYVRFKLTREYATDKAGGAGTILFDIRKRDWSGEVVDALGIDSAWLPTTFEGTAITGQINPDAAEFTGLKAGTPVIAGGGDQAAGAVGTGTVYEGTVSISLGTSGVVFASTNEPIIEPEGRLHAFCHAVPDKWHLMGVMLSAAGSLRWYRDTLAPDVDFDALVEPAADAPRGSDGLLFLPYLTGERTPYSDPLARGAFVGLTVRHTRSHLTRSVLEGVAFGLRDSFELMRASGLADISQARLTGGGAKSKLWRQILADVLGVQLVTVNSTEGAAYGAAILAATGTGIYDSVETACETIIHVTGVTEPVSTDGVYEALYPLYRQLYPALRPNFESVANIGL